MDLKRDNSITALFGHMQRFVDLDTKQQTQLADYFTYRTYSENEYLLKSGEKTSERYFLLSGCCRSFCIPAGKPEQTLQFLIENWWVADFNALLTGSPAALSVQAVVPTETLVLQEDNAQKLFEAVPAFDRYFRMVMERAYTATLKKLELLLCHSAAERYHRFTSLYPNFAHRVPSAQLASFLGMTPDTLKLLNTNETA